MAGKLQPEYRAAAELIKGNIQLAQGDYVTAVDTLKSSPEHLDSWLVHLELEKAYFAAGFYAEALSEFEMCKSSIGEATSVFLDDTPSFRYARSLEDWLQNTQAKLGF